MSIEPIQNKGQNHFVQFNFCFKPSCSNNELASMDKRRIAINHMKSWFAIRLYCCHSFWPASAWFCKL